MYVNVNVNKPIKPNAGAGGDVKDRVVFFDWADVLTHPVRDSKGISIVGNINLKPGAYMIEMYMTPDSFHIGTKGDGETDAKGIVQTFKMAHPGSEVEQKEFRFNWLNRNIGIIAISCSTNRKQLLGSHCSPLGMKFDANHDKDKNKAEFTFESLGKGPDVGEYFGTITLAEPVATIAANATEINLASGEGRYQTTSGTAAVAEITTVANAVDGLVFTLVGSGGAYPTEINSGGDFLLKNGTSWSALADSAITFKVFKDGASSYKLIETSRT